MALLDIFAFFSKALSVIACGVEKLQFARLQMSLIFRFWLDPFFKLRQLTRQTLVIGYRTMFDQNQKLSDQTKNTSDILSDGKNSRQN